MNEEDQNQNSTEASSMGSSEELQKAAAEIMQNMIDEDKRFTLEMAHHVWEKVKGYPIPDCYSEKDRLEIFERYYHRAVSQSQGE